MQVFVALGRRTHIVASDPTEAMTDAVLETSLTEPALCGRRPAGGWLTAWQDDEDADLCDRCARLVEGRGGWHQAGA